MCLVTKTTAKSFAFLLVNQASADMWQITTFSSNSRLMAYVVFTEDLENGMVVQEWQGNDAAKALDPRYGSEGGFPTRGLIPQDVMHTHPEAVITDESRYLRDSMPALMRQVAVIETLVTDVVKAQ